MNKYSKIQATLKALSNPAIGIDSISQLALIVELGRRCEFSSKEIKSESDNKHHLYNKLKNKGMFTMISSRGKTKPAIMKLSAKGRDVYNVIVGRNDSQTVSDTLADIHQHGINRLNPCLLLVKLGGLKEYTRRDMLDDVEFKNEPFVRRAGFTREVRKVKLTYSNGASYLKPVYRLTVKGDAVLNNLMQLVH